MKERTKKDLIKYRIALSNETIGEVEELINLGYYRTSVNRIYYACFYALSALLLKNKINAHSHSGVIRMFGLHFVKTKKIPAEMGGFYTDLFDKRLTGDYDDFIEFDKETVNDLYKTAKKFVSTVEDLI